MALTKEAYRPISSDALDLHITRAASTMTAKQRTIVLTVDAFGTLFTPREPIAKQYGDVARKHGLSGFTDEEIEKSFRVGNAASSVSNLP